VARLQGLHLCCDPKQLAQKIFNVRRERNDQLGSLFVGSRPRVRACIQQLRFKTRIGLSELIEERCVHPEETCTCVEVLKLEAKAERMVIGSTWHSYGKTDSLTVAALKRAEPTEPRT